ncbi:hypothetical protein [Legionella gresilensis]|uniref:hypothetical protein n=1 Tax=Legionella gresilensis TaxID=91823 RepID=UPI0013EFA197|nr:hypothetical protein [Legionella gresilensis]
MKVNLTDYLSTFAAFDPTFDALKNNPLVKVKSCYQTTKTFLASLDKHSTSFPQLKEIRTKIADINEFFANMLLEQTNGALQLGENANIQLAKSRNKISHVLAKKIIQNPDEFIKSIQEFIEEVRKDINRSKQITLDEKQKIDDVDLKLLNSSTVSLSYQGTFFGGSTDINEKTYRSNQSLFANNDFKKLTNSPVQIQGQSELLNITAMLQQFIDRASGVDNKFGFIPEESFTNTFTI